MSAIAALKTAHVAPDDCFHCGLPLPPPDSARRRSSAGHAFCCAGCEAAASAITELGLADYYRLRDTPAPPPIPDDAIDGAEFDDPSLVQRYVTRLDNGCCEARLLVEGMRCAACGWLLERALGRLAGVDSAVVHLASRRIDIRWRETAIRPGALIDAIRRLGYVAFPFEDGRAAAVEARARRRLLRRLWVAGLCMMQVMMYAVPGYIALDGEISGDVEQLMRWAGFVLTLPVVLYCATPFWVGAWQGVRGRAPGMDVPIAVGIGAAFAASVGATLVGEGAVYFDAVTMFVFLLLGARYLERVALGAAGRSLAGLRRLVPQRALRLRGTDNLAADSVLASTLAPGDRVLVRPGDAVPADGMLESAEATLNEAWLSGESRAVARGRGDRIACGSINAGSALVLAVTRVGADTAFSGILRMIDRASADKPRWVSAAERAVPLFIAAILVAALLAFGAWLAIDPSRAPAIAIAVLIVTCPCALALATPVATTVAIGAMAKADVAVTRGGAIEALAGVTDVVFDKTGTLTIGAPALVKTVALADVDSVVALRIASALAEGSSHPLDAALRSAHAHNEGADDGDARGAPTVTAHHAVPGEGIEALVDGVRYRLGRADFAAAIAGTAAPYATLDRSATTAWLASERGWIGAFHFRDTPRDDARDAVRQLGRHGVAVHLLSGDDEAIVRETGRALGIRELHGRATPDDKCRVVRDLQHAGRRVLMVGDGINDAPVLAQADVSIAMNSGPDLAKVRADAVLLSNAPSDVASAIRIARRTRAIIRQNLAWALGYNAVAIPLAVTGHVSPLIAGLGMSLSSLGVVVNSLRAR